jgi:hypothetical protein
MSEIASENRIPNPLDRDRELAQVQSKVSENAVLKDYANALHTTRQEQFPA